MNARDYSRLIAPAAFDERPECAKCGELRDAVNDNGVCRGCVVHALASACPCCGAPDDEACMRGCRYAADEAIEAHHVGVRGRS